MRSFEMESAAQHPFRTSQAVDFERDKSSCRCIDQNVFAFWLLGLLNNSAYVIMIAGANSISSAAIGLVYLCAVLPGVVLKASAPYWFHLVAYSTRIVIAAVLMGSSFTIVAFSRKRHIQLLGVILASFQSSLGEASCLALSTHYSGPVSITAWSSGTGFAGVFGYAWVAVLHVIIGMGFKLTLMLAWAIVFSWLFVYFILLEPPEARTREVKRLVLADNQLVESAMNAFRDAPLETSRNLIQGVLGRNNKTPVMSKDSRDLNFTREEQEMGTSEEYDATLLRSENLAGDTIESVEDASASLLHGNSSNRFSVDDTNYGIRKQPRAWEMSAKQRFQQVLALWPYTIPLMAVYFAEYAMQSGAWTAIGFPVSDESARKKFYVYANWLYQAGVFISRSSGTIWQAGFAALWAMPIMQCGMLAFFLVNAVVKFWYNWSLLVPCFVTGLLGGAVYVNAFTLISRNVEPRVREFSLGAASVADGIGVALADAVGILIQGCLFRVNNLDGADFKC